MAHKNRIFFLGVGVGLAGWFLESAMDAFVFKTGSFSERILPLQDPDETWMRVLTVAIVVLFGSVANRMVDQIHAAYEKLKGAEEQLTINKEILENAQRIAHVGSWHLDIEKNILVWSDEVYRIFGLHRGEFSPSYDAFLSFVHPDDRELVDRTYTASLASDTPYEVVHRIVRPNGEMRVVQEKSENIRDATGKVVHSFGMVHDITEERRSEQEREALISQLQRSLSEIKTLRGIIPICSFCKKIRDDQGAWSQIESYMQEHSEADFSHGICPECMQEHYPHIRDEK